MNNHKPENKRASALYNLLAANPNEWFTQKEISMYVGGYKYHERNNDCCPMIREDMLYINENTNFEKIIICKDYCFKIANEKEAAEYVLARKRRLINEAKQISALKFKMKRNGYPTWFIGDVTWKSYVEDL